MTTTVPMVPLTTPMSTQKLEVRITWTSYAMQSIGSKPPVSSADALAAFGSTVYVFDSGYWLASGWLLARSLSTLCSITASIIGWR